MARGNFKYDWPDIQRYYDQGHGYLECRARYGFAKDTWRKAIRERRLVVRPRQWPLDKILRESKSRYTIKRRLIEGGILRNVCDECGVREWRGKPLTIQIDHRNGIHDDHRLENLRMLCPNCHSQTETYAARNRQRGSKRRIE
ncbi:MAG: HNH endonuclease [bacterium]|nr:HNH endonuclease [bacterium]